MRARAHLRELMTQKSCAVGMCNVKLGNHLNQASSTPSNLIRRVKTILEQCLFRVGPLVPLKRAANRDILILTERDWSQESCLGKGTTVFILFPMRCRFLVPRLKISAPIFQEIFLIQYLTILVAQLHSLLHHHFPNLHNTKMLISLKRRQICQKGKHHFALFFKSLQISSNYFSFHSHFKHYFHNLF